MDVKVSCLRPERLPQSLERDLEHAGRSAPPTRVNGRDGASPVIDEEHRNTVCSRDGEQHPGLSGDMTVARVDESWVTVRYVDLDPSMHAYLAAMRLRGVNNTPGAGHSFEVRPIPGHSFWG